MQELGSRLEWAQREIANADARATAAREEAASLRSQSTRESQALQGLEARASAAEHEAESLREALTEAREDGAAQAKAAREEGERQLEQARQRWEAEARRAKEERSREWELHETELRALRQARKEAQEVRSAAGLVAGRLAGWPAAGWRRGGALTRR